MNYKRRGIELIICLLSSDLAKRVRFWTLKIHHHHHESTANTLKNTH
jgi:hypothetical protein